MDGDEAGHPLHRVKAGDVHRAAYLRKGTHPPVEEGRVEDFGNGGDLTRGWSGFQVNRAARKTMIHLHQLAGVVHIGQEA